MGTTKPTVFALGRNLGFSRSYDYKSDIPVACKQTTFKIQINSELVKKGCHQPAKIDFSTIEVDWNGIKEQSERIQKYFQEGGKPEELSEIKFIKPFSL